MQEGYCGIMPKEDKRGKGAGLGNKRLSAQCRSDRVPTNPVGSCEVKISCETILVLGRIGEALLAPLCADID